MAKIELKELRIISPGGELCIEEIDDYDVMYDETKEGYDVFVTAHTKSAVRLEARA